MEGMQKNSPAACLPAGRQESPPFLWEGGEKERGRGEFLP